MAFRHPLDLPAPAVDAPWRTVLKVHDGAALVEVDAHAVGEREVPMVGLTVGGTRADDSRVLVLLEGPELAALAEAQVKAAEGAWGEFGPVRPCTSIRELHDRLMVWVDVKRVSAALGAALHGLEAAARAGDDYAYRTLEKVIGAFNQTPSFDDEDGAAG